ncbi:MAG: short-chain isoprenyl diphosphate synthase [Lachnospiraceae bacterium]|nr:short-chain isoprenyl diphosphate synthase [Lachnospiraceae bacterium]
MKKHALCIMVLAGILLMSGCGGQQDVHNELVQKPDSVSAADDDLNTDDIIKLYQEIYDEVTASYTVDGIQSLETIENIIKRLGEHGYSAIDSGNQVDMVQKEQVLRFCESIEQSKEAQLTIWVVDTPEKLYGYHLSTEEGKVDVVKEHYQYNNVCFVKAGSVRYTADSWQYTNEGYLIFTGSSYSEQSYVLTMSDVPEVTALRVEPLDIKCRELNRLYMLPIGYGRNNMFLCDWSGDDYDELDFYDAFDRFYSMIYGQPVPYLPDENINIGAVYQIPEEEFENMLMKYLPADKDRIRSHTKYVSEKKVYEYRPRGFYEAEYTNIPYPEVVDYVTNDDGTVTLTVNAVYPSESTSKAYTHEVVVRPLEDGGFQYVSNKMLPSKDDYSTSWHTDRLTEEEWEKIYEENSGG